MFHEFKSGQLDDEGRIGPIKDICVVAAQRVFLVRCGTDTNPLLVQMIYKGEMLPHWYYRSEKWIDQPYIIAGYFIQPYRGLARLAYPGHYGLGTYVIDDKLMELTRKGFA